jgi:hypothetical protein
MQIDKIQNYNNIQFTAKLKIINKFFNTTTLNKFNEKAKLIGQENDIIELRYTNFRDKYTDITEPNQLSIKLKNVSDIFKARFIKNNGYEETENYMKRISANNYADFWDKEEEVANKYLDKLLEIETDGK